MENNNKIKQDIVNGFFQHGYAFQSYCKDIVKPDFTEYPVSIGDKNTQIDLLKKTRVILNEKTYQLIIVYECKLGRAKYNSWVFSDPYPESNNYSTMIECGSKPSQGKEKIYNSQYKIPGIDKHYSNWVAINHNPKENRDNNKKGTSTPIEKALSQVLLGYHALVKETKQHIDDSEFSYVIFYPIILTSANLFELKYSINDLTCDFDIKEGTGQINEIPFAIVDYALHEDYIIKPDNYVWRDWATIKFSIKARSVAIVNINHYKKFENMMNINK